MVEAVLALLTLRRIRGRNQMRLKKELFLSRVMQSVAALE